MGSPFDVATLAEAKAIILTSDPTGSRWDIETPYLAGLIHEWLAPTDILLDYGCGVGRLAKPLVEDYGCLVLGYDTSPSMRKLAQGYVGNSAFLLTDSLDRRKVSGAYAVWTLQHSENPEGDLWDIWHALPHGGKFLLVNETKRFVPMDGNWVNDGLDILQMAQQQFVCRKIGDLSQAFVPHGASAYWALLERL